MKHGVHVFEDRQFIDEDLPAGLREKLDENKLTTADGARFMFCGVVGFGSEIAAFLPRNSDAESISEHDSACAAAELLKALRRYLETRSSAIYAGEVDEDGVSGGELLGLAFSLADDFFDNGLFATRIAERRVNEGKTDWARTMSRSALHLSEDSPVYIELEGAVKRVDTDCETARIHAEVLRSLDDRLGWLVNGEAGLIASQLPHVQKSALERPAQLNHLRLELHRTYSDRNIRLVRQLISFIETDHPVDESSFVIGVRKFEGMWEHMLANTLENVLPINNRLAGPVYRVSGKLVRDRSKGQRTDVVTRNPANGHIAILDAKYYAARSTGSAPGWPDLVKQYFYEKAIRSVYPDDTISNVFVFPGASGPIQSVHMAAPGSVEVTCSDLDDENYPPIVCVYARPMAVLRNYILGHRVALAELLSGLNGSHE